MGRKKTKFKAYGKETHYWRDEMKPLLLAYLCLALAIEHSTEASNIYQQIIEAWEKPDCQELLKGNIELPKDEIMAWVNSAANNTVHESEFDIWTDLYKEYGKSDDFKYLFNLISEFIKVGFNRKADILNNEYKVIASKSIWLCFAIGISTAGYNLENHPELENIAKIKLGDRVLDLSALEGVSDQRLHRKYTKGFKIFGFKMNHDEKLRNMARLWHLSRVVYSGPEQCSIKLQLEGENWTSDNLVKEIHQCDLAMGYPRKNVIYEPIELE